MRGASKRSLAVAVLAFLLVSVPRLARADKRSLRVDYSADATCPDARSFVELAKVRVRAWPEASDNPDLVARASAHRQRGVFVGQLTLEDASGASLGTREIREASCDDVVLALALFLAVAIEADAEAAARAKTAEEPPLPDEAPQDPAPAAPKPEAIRRPKALPAITPQRSAAWLVVASAHAVTGRTPNIAPGASIALEVRSRKRSLLAPFGGIGFDIAPLSTTSEGRGQVDFGWAAAIARMCAAFDRFREVDGLGRWEPWLCVRVEAGALRAASRGYERNRSDVRRWFAGGAEVGLAYWLTPGAGVTLHGGVSLPLVQHEFVLNEAPLFRAPWIAAELGIGLKLRAW